MPSDENLAAGIRLHRGAAEAARQRGDAGEARRQDEQVDKLKHSLYYRLLPLVHVLGRRFAGLLRGAGLEPGDLPGELYLRFDQAVARFTPHSGASLRTYFRTVFRNRVIELARRSRLTPHEDIDALLAGRQRQAFERQHRQAEVRDALSRILPHDPRRRWKVRLFEEYHLDGVNIPALSRRYRVSVSTVFKALVQAAASFREVWTDPEPPPPRPARGAA